MLIDSLDRKIDYLRLSVTDRCNLRCSYCLPKLYSNFSSTSEIMSDEDVVCLVRAFAELGISKLRITGGEPLLRSGLPSLIKKLRELKSIDDISLSTNGILLNKFAPELSDAGLDRINISIDSLNADKYKSITSFGEISDVLKGIECALEYGFSPVKLNVVVSRGMNEDEINDFATLTETYPVHVRFIELMPMGETGYFSFERRVPLDEMMQLAQPLEPIPVEDWPKGSGPAKYFRRPNGIGSVGFISPLSSNFCSDCNRMRLSAKGILIPCLANNQGTDLLSMLRTGADENEIKNSIKLTVSCKPEKHLMMETATNGKSYPQFMCQMGG